MGLRKNWAKYDAEQEKWVNETKYHFEKIKKILIPHFTRGGGLSNQIIAGKLMVTVNTVKAWRNNESHLYHEEFDKLVLIYSNASVAKLDDAHRMAAMGKLEKANATVLNRRAAHYLGMTEKVETTNKSESVVKFESLEEIDAEIAKLEAEIKEEEK